MGIPGGAAVGRLAALALLACSTVGCRPGYNLKLSLDPQYAAKLGDQRAFVHVAPVNQSDRQQLEDMSLETYWQYGNAAQEEVVRERATKMFELSADNRSSTLSASDPVWKRWKANGANELMVVSSLPIPAADAPGERDPRRRFIPIHRQAWVSKDVRVVLTEGGLRVQTARAK